MRYYLQLYGFFKYEEEKRLALPCVAMALKNKLCNMFDGLPVCFEERRLIWDWNALLYIPSVKLATLRFTTSTGTFFVVSLSFPHSIALASIQELGELLALSMAIILPHTIAVPAHVRPCSRYTSTITSILNVLSAPPATCLRIWGTRFF